MNTKSFSAFVLALGLASSAAQAAIFDRGGGLIYDDVLNVTWLSDANYVKTGGYDADGNLNWNEATTWAADLSYYDSVRNVTYTDWRLPDYRDIAGACDDVFRDCGSELGHLFYDLYNYVTYLDAEYLPVNEYTPKLANTALFQNQKGLREFSYWTNYEQGDVVAYFGENRIGQFENRFVLNFAERATGAWAVRSGNVTAVPEVDTWIMLLAGLGLVSTMAKRRERYNV